MSNSPEFSPIPSAADIQKDLQSETITPQQARDKAQDAYIAHLTQPSETKPTPLTSDPFKDFELPNTDPSPQPTKSSHE